MRPREKPALHKSASATNRIGIASRQTHLRRVQRPSNQHRNVGDGPDDAVHVLPADAKIGSRFPSCRKVHSPFFRRNSMHSMRHVALSVVVLFALLFAALTVSPLGFAMGTLTLNGDY